MKTEEDKMEVVKAKVMMFLFARWIATCYEGELNSQGGDWYNDQLDHFIKVVFPNYIENGTVADTEKYLKKFK
jgi:hypothetical protein